MIIVWGKTLASCSTYAVRWL